jgi:hypothetical protein
MMRLGYTGFMEVEQRENGKGLRGKEIEVGDGV